MPSSRSIGHRVAVVATCRCVDVEVLQGVDAVSYVEEHLVLLPPPDHEREYWPDYGLDGWSEWRCPEDRALWHGNPWNGAFELRRRPRTSRGDYLDVAVITTRSLVINAAQADVRRWVGVDRDQHLAATRRMWIAMQSLYSPDWRQIVEDLRLGDPTAVEPAVVFLEADPRCHRSGYQKETLCRFLSRIDPAPEMALRLRRIAAAAEIDPNRPKRERDAFRALVASLQNSA
jgi:hypothetical protein